jgi:hypothetical protein
MNRGLLTAMPWILAVLCALATPAIAEDARAPILTAIFPSGGEVPANHLKFYIHFSQPMRQGVFLRHCSLLDDRGNEVPEPFRETELWSGDRLRLTLWLHPGRQKTGVNLNEEFGPVLNAGRSYTLVVSGKWPSDDGIALGADTRKKYRAIARAAERLDTAAWRPTPPPAGSTAPLSVRFPAPLDHALLLRCIRVLDAENKPVPGSVTVGEREQSWSFTPSHPWESAAHILAADSILEDLAGNSLARPFEVDLTAAAPDRRPATITIPFRPVLGPR